MTFARTLYLSFLTLLPIAGAAQEPVQRIEIAGSAANARRDDSAARIVVGRDDIARHGDSTLSALLKRQPGVSLAGGEIRLRGLGAGYTQLLVDGDPAPAGFSIDSIAPAMIERIEILRTATADLGSQAIAGTINVILRKGGNRRQQDVKLGAGLVAGRFDPSVSMQWGDRSGALAYSLSGEAARIGTENAYLTHETVRDAAGAIITRREQRERAEFRNTRLNLAPRLNWTLEGGDTLAWHTFFDLARAANHGDADETVLAGGASSYPVNGFRYDGDTVSARSDINWARRVGDEGKLTVRAGVNHNRRESDYVFRGAGAGRTLVRTVVSDAVDDSTVLSGKFVTPLQAAHSIAIGWEGGATRRTESRLQSDTSAQGAGLGGVDEDYRAAVRRLALFAQDEWRVDARLQAYFGLRWEGLRTATSGRTLEQVRSSSSVFSPVAQLLWQLPGSSKDQLRLALSRTYKAPPVRNLVPRRYTVNNGNGPTNPDMRGNPALRPELAWGLDAAVESYFGKNGVMSVSAYARRIDQVTVQTLYQEGGAWITTPFNNGRARAAGLEFDTRFPLRSLWAGAPDMDVRANAARNWSVLEAVPGPHNRIGDQARVTANVGIDARIAADFNGGASLNLQFGGPARISSSLRAETGPVRSLDLYALWRAGGGMQLRLSAANALHQDRRTARRYADEFGGTERISRESSAAIVRLVLEKAL